MKRIAPKTLFAAAALLASTLLVSSCEDGELQLGEYQQNESRGYAASSICEVGATQPCTVNEGIIGAAAECNMGAQSCIDLGDGELVWGACAPAASDPTLCEPVDCGIDSACATPEPEPTTAPAPETSPEPNAEHEATPVPDDTVYPHCGMSELCDNGVDDDCDGTVDDGCGPETCEPGAIVICATSCSSQGLRTCTGDSVWGACETQGELCGNNFDDDCNGQADENCCTPGSNTSCTTSCGSQGKRTCDASANWSETCAAAAEVCDNGADDDCDGQVDENCSVELQDCGSYNFGHCNGDMGYGDHCAASDNTNGCTSSSFWAWCNRRNPAYPEQWDNAVRSWVTDRCNGTLEVSGATYSCLSSNRILYQCTTPLVMVFEPEQDVELRASSQPSSFPLEPTSDVRWTHDWPTAATPWLVRDLDHNGQIDSGRELFGSQTNVARDSASTDLAENGFVALAVLDSDGNHSLSANDAAWTELALWSDVDNDRVTDEGELHTLTEAQITRIELSYSLAPRCDARGNCEIQQARFWYQGANGVERQGRVADMNLRQSRVLEPR
ncbi:MAG: hypothetical protein AUK47_01895 [Deltaproteobacteria bacterium CG2_30_63_29]|nr:MAG: hypothetical protein AUK47_01895 [Deltaproteobacteria bacterium CG2_30_63_29]PJB39147.1 MAG: hypothetical protein CO108_17725 [Deltaproteobacteria bacterium CG_4_9_14_3_um_filter_63_12]